MSTRRIIGTQRSTVSNDGALFCVQTAFHPAIVARMKSGGMFEGFSSAHTRPIVHRDVTCTSMKPMAVSPPASLRESHPMAMCSVTLLNNTNSGVVPGTEKFQGKSMSI